MLIKQNQSMWYYKPHQKIDKNSAMQFAKTEKAKIILRRNHVNEKQIKLK